MIMDYIFKRIQMKRQRLTPKLQQRKNDKSLSPLNMKLKVKTKENQQTHRKGEKQNQLSINKQEKSLKICLDLANYHRIEAEELKIKNQVLQCRLNDQLCDMQNLKKELANIKNILHCNQMIKKDNQQLKVQNSSLRKQNQKLTQQLDLQKTNINELNRLIAQYKQKKTQTESVILVGQSKCENYDINTLTLAKQSRRQQYAKNYQFITFVPSISCLQCAKKANQIEQMKQKYCNQLRKLQEQVVQLQRSQIAIQVMQNQIFYKNQCIDYLVQQLDNLEGNSNNVLEVMSLLQQKIQKFKYNNHMAFDYRSQKLNDSFARSVQ